MIAFLVAMLGSAPRNQIAYVSDHEGTFEIYLVNPDGTGEKRLTQNKAFEGALAWSPDRSKLAFSSDLRPADHDSNSDIWVINTDGSGLKRLTSSKFGESGARWSPNGAKFVYWREGDIWVMNADGSGQRMLAKGPATDASWSPDGKQIVFQSSKQGESSNIFTMTAEGKRRRQLTHLSTAYRPMWSPSGKKILFGTEAGIYVIDADGENLKRLSRAAGPELTIEVNPDYDPVWSPDGKKIAFDRLIGEDREVFTMNADGSDQRQITNTRIQASYPKWSPDGKQILFGTHYLSYEVQNIGLVNADGSGYRKLTDFPRSRSFSYSW